MSFVGVERMRVAVTVEYSIQVENRLWAVVEDPVTVVVAEDSYLVREALSGLLYADPRVWVEGMATDYESALGLVGDLCPDVVVTDVRMPPSQTDEGIRLAAALRASHPRTGVVVLSQYADPTYAIALVEAGSHGRGYLLKERVADLDQLVSTGAVPPERSKSTSTRSSPNWVSSATPAWITGSALSCCFCRSKR